MNTRYWKDKKRSRSILEIKNSNHRFTDSPMPEYYSGHQWNDNHCQTQISTQLDKSLKIWTFIKKKACSNDFCISYSSKDVKTAENIQEYLSLNGFDI